MGFPIWPWGFGLDSYLREVAEILPVVRGKEAMTAGEGFAEVTMESFIIGGVRIKWGSTRECESVLKRINAAHQRELDKEWDKAIVYVAQKAQNEWGWGMESANKILSLKRSKGI